MLANFRIPGPNRTPKALTHYGYTTHLVIEPSPSMGERFVKKFLDGRNHRLAKEGKSPYLYSYHNMTDEGCFVPSVSITFG